MTGEQNRRVIIADDHAVFRAGLRGFVEAAGFDVVAEVGDGAAAIAQVARQRPDIVLMDWRMPIMDGLQATQRIRHEFDDVAVIFITTDDSDDVRRAAINAGACAHVLKGDAQRLADALRMCVA